MSISPSQELDRVIQRDAGVLEMSRLAMEKEKDDVKSRSVVWGYPLLMLETDIEREGQGVGVQEGNGRDVSTRACPSLCEHTVLTICQSGSSSGSYS